MDFPEVIPIRVSVAISHFGGSETNTLFTKTPSTEFWPMKYEWQFSGLGRGDIWESFYVAWGSPPLSLHLQGHVMWLLQLSFRGNLAARKRKKNYTNTSSDVLRRRIAMLPTTSLQISRKGNEPMCLKLLYMLILRLVAEGHISMVPRHVHGPSMLGSQ